MQDLFRPICAIPVTIREKKATTCLSHFRLEISMFEDVEHLSDFLNQMHLAYFGELFRIMRATAKISQTKLAELANSKSDEAKAIKAIKENKALEIVEKETNIGLLDQSAISLVQSGKQTATVYQLYFWLVALKHRLKEMNMELDSQIEDDYYLLALGGPPSKLKEAMERVEKIGSAQRRTIVHSVIESEEETGLICPILKTACPVIQQGTCTDMHASDVIEVQRAIKKIKESGY